MSEYLKGEGGLKFQFCQILEGRLYVNQGHGEGGIENSQKNLMSFMDGPYLDFYPEFH